MSEKMAGNERCRREFSEDSNNENSANSQVKTAAIIRTPGRTVVGRGESANDSDEGLITVISNRLKDEISRLRST